MEKGFADNRELIVCGWDEVFIIDFNRSQQKVWSWKAADCPDLPDSFKELFKTTDECKPFDRGQKVLIASSGGAVAYVDRQHNQVLFYGKAANAHSADILPDNRLAVAASHDPAGQGDRLILFDLSQPDQPLWRDELSWAHGVVWDDQRQRVWTLGHSEIKIYELAQWHTANPALAQVATVELPEGGGHDMYPLPNTAYLSLSTSANCWLLDRDSLAISKHPELAEQMRVKSICQHPQTGQIVYVQGTTETWWTDKLNLLKPEAEYYVPGEHFYKARWNIRVE